MSSLNNKLCIKVPLESAAAAIGGPALLCILLPTHFCAYFPFHLTYYMIG